MVKKFNNAQHKSSIDGSLTVMYSSCC